MKGFLGTISDYLINTMLGGAFLFVPKYVVPVCTYCVFEL